MLLGAGHGLRGTPDPGSFDVPMFASAARQALGPSVFSTAYERGRVQPREAVLAPAQAPPEALGALTEATRGSDWGARDSA